MGDITPSDLTAADIDRPEMIRKYIKDVRETYLLAYDTRNEGPPPHLTPSALSSRMRKNGRPLCSRQPAVGFPLSGSSDEHVDLCSLLVKRFGEVGLVPLPAAKSVSIFPGLETRVRNGVETSILDAVVFDYDGVHYLYNDQLGTLALPLPQNPGHRIACLAVRKGDVLESLYFRLRIPRASEGIGGLCPALMGSRGRGV